MKKQMVLGLSLLTTLAGMSFASAAPVHSTTFRFECPNASSGKPSERLTNYGTYISGMGEENVNGAKKSHPIFRGIPGALVPLDLSTGGYVHAGTLFNEKTGRVTCLFTSTTGSENFNVSYVAENLIGGVIVKTDNSAITLKAFQGAK